jgi:hypothetical protein
VPHFNGILKLASRSEVREFAVLLSLQYMTVKGKKIFDYITFLRNRYANIVRQFKSEVYMEKRLLAPWWSHRPRHLRSGKEGVKYILDYKANNSWSSIVIINLKVEPLFGLYRSWNCLCNWPFFSLDVKCPLYSDLLWYSLCLRFAHVL